MVPIPKHQVQLHMCSMYLYVCITGYVCCYVDAPTCIVDSIVSRLNPSLCFLQSLLKAGYVVRITSKVYGKCLRILENGVADCEGGIGTASEFLVLFAGPQTSIIRLRNMALPQFHLAIVNGYLVGYVSKSYVNIMYTHVHLESQILQILYTYPTNLCEQYVGC